MSLFFQAGTFICNFKLSGNALLVGRQYVVYQISQHEIATNKSVVSLQIIATDFNMGFF